MLTHHLRHLAIVVLAGMLAACVPVTVNVNFPQEKIEGAAGSIEDMVRSPENPKPAPPKKGPQGSLGPSWLAAVSPREAGAQTRLDVPPEIRTRTPELMKAIESRRGRFPEIRELKEHGCVGETNQGLLEARPGQSCPPDLAKIIAAENADRTYIYETLMQQNNIPAGDATRVRAAFAKVHRERARPGNWIQLESGEWVKKS
jgi:uncharacterized protein YdbL (DUF1318 family)